jgi:hypothetical protein
VVVAAAGPVAFATLLVVAFIALDIAGRTPSAIAAMSVAESAGLGLGGETLRRVEAGEDPRQIQNVRAEIISSSVRRVTALEAAVFARKVELVRMLDRRGHIADAAMRRQLACLAVDLAARDIVEYLSHADASACPRGAALAAIVQRSRPS